MFIRGLHNSLVRNPDNGGLKEAKYEYDNIIISDSTLRSLFPPQLLKISEQYKVVCGCECYISAKSIHSSSLSCRDWYFKKLKDQSQNSQNRKSGEKLNFTYEIYKNTVMQGFISIPKHLICKRQKCFQIHSHIMH